MKIGVQLYTVHDYCTNLDDFAETLKKIADIGYTTVQVSGTCAYEAEWLKNALKEAGLSCGITHYGTDKIFYDTENTIKFHDTFGCNYIGVGGITGATAGLDEFVEKGIPAAKKIKEAGKMFMYHNHNWEYENFRPDGKTIMEYLADQFPADIMGFTLDTYWCKFGGYEPLDEIKRLKGRLPCVHLKDMFCENNNPKMTWIGSGNVMNFEKIIDAFIDAGTKYAYYEQDDCNGMDPMECVKKSYDYLHSLGLE